jgi:hypothetical protein
MDRFHTKTWMKSPHIQTALGSLKLRVLGKNPLVDCANETVIDSSGGVRLLGYYSAQPKGQSKGLITLLHGWEGSTDSAYILSTGKYFFSRGYEIFRLNLRDHGASHHLNEGLFHGALIEETHNALRRIADLSKGRPNYIVGFSLGGNFALRVAFRQTQTGPIANLKHTVCISPPLDPLKATLAIDNGLPVYRFYFLRKWKRSLKMKQALFPRRYNFNRILKLNTCMAMTEALMPYYPDYKSYREYFNQYTLGAGSFEKLSTFVTVIISEDDPVVPAADFYPLKKNGYLDILIQKNGGHCGFFESSPFDCWYEKKIAAIIQKEATQP